MSPHESTHTEPRTGHDAPEVVVMETDRAAEREAGTPRLDTWTVGRARLVAFKADRLLSAAQRELGGFGESTLSADLAPDLLEASERVGEAIAVLQRLQERLRAGERAGDGED